MKIILVVGTRPNLMKVAPLMRALAEVRDIEQILVHTGQHYDKVLSSDFFEELGIPKPDIALNIGSDTHARQVAQIMMKFEEVCDAQNPHLVIVLGDVNSTLACSVVAAQKGIKLLHVEAGIRSGDRSMPEEINRLVCDSIADYLLPPTQDAVDNLLREGHHNRQIELVGNIMIDTLKHFQAEIQASTVLEQLGVEPGRYACLTLHRPSNVDHEVHFKQILIALKHIQEKCKLIFPIHPRTQKMIDKFGLESEFDQMPNLIRTLPLGYFDFGKLLSNAQFVLTDSGGIQEETTVYGVPCITLRENTERPITVTEGSNVLAGGDPEKIICFAEEILNGQWKKSTIPDLWDGKTAQRIVQFIENRRSEIFI